MKLYLFALLVLLCQVCFGNNLRGIGMGASCSEIEAIETPPSIHRIEFSPEEFVYRTTHKGFPAFISYKCSEDSWSQSVTYGEFDKDEAADELAKLKEEITETYGNMKPLIRDRFIRLFLWVFNHPLVERTYSYICVEDYEISMYFDIARLGEEKSEKPYAVTISVANSSALCKNAKNYIEL